jgi:hypothetical protein
MNSDENTFQFTTKLWKRSQNSYASTIPQNILAIKGAPIGEDSVVHWSINPETGVVEVRFGTEEDGDDE